MLRLLVRMLKVVMALLIQSKEAMATKNELVIAIEDRVCAVLDAHTGFGVLYF